MGPDEHHGIDWREARAYAQLLDADRSIFAWEWLRRDPRYCLAANAAFDAAGGGADASEAGPWGLVAFEAPELAAPKARPVWAASAYPYVLGAEAAPTTVSADSFDIERVRGLLTIVRGRDGRQHLLFSDGLRAIRIDVIAGTVMTGHAQFRYQLAGFGSAEKPLLTLRRLLALHRAGRFSRSLHAHEVRARRWLLVLRAADALAA